MLEKLKQRWGVNSFNLLLIICTFALGGSLCGMAGRKLLELTGMEKGGAWIVVYLVLIALLWPICVILISIPFGQFPFFKRYLLKIGGRMTGNRKQPVMIAIFASGTGSNAQKIIDRFRGSPVAKVALIVCNKEGAGILSIAEREHIPVLLTTRLEFFKERSILQELEKNKVAFIVLAGFLWKVPPVLIRAYTGKIVNIHPALLPKYGGKGMYGYHVHEAVIAAGEKESGISIHLVDELYDHGQIIRQEKCSVSENETAVSLAQKIHSLEHQFYPNVVEDFIKMQNRS